MQDYQDNLISTRADAKNFGMIRYFTGKPCSRGHVSPRHVSTSGCIDCVAIYNKSYKRNNPVKTRAVQRKSIAKNVEKIRASSRERMRVWRLKNPERSKAIRDAYVVRNTEKVRDRTRVSRGLPRATRPCPEMCEACGTRKAKALDHCHSTNKFRGWLCAQCNTSLGMAGDTIEGLEKLMTYLRSATCQQVG
jgi:hypothetical protein